MRKSGIRSLPAPTLVLLLLAALCLSAWPKTPANSAEQADRIVILKSQRTLTLYRQGQVLKTYKVALGSHPVGPKTERGDHRTPEGVYTIDSRNPRSQRASVALPPAISICSPVRGQET